MKTRIHTLLLGLAALSTLLPQPSTLLAQGTAFTYQGRLDEEGMAVNGEYDLSFSLWDATSGPSQIGLTQTNLGVAVSNGLFTVDLHFGEGVFTGEPRWLEISVATNGSESFEALSPRHALLPTPYAVFAANASNVVSGSVVKSLNALTDDVTLAPGANVTITPSGNTLTIDSAGAGGSGIWSLNGADTYFNGGSVGIGTDAPQSALEVRTGTGFAGIKHTDGLIAVGSYVGSSSSGAAGGWLGTFSLDPLHFFVNNGQPSMTVTTGGNVGIGTTTPATRLTVRTQPLGFDPYGVEHTDGNIRLTTYLGGGGWLGTRSAHPLYFFVNNGTASVTLGTNGNLGIGTTPRNGNRLDVSGIATFASGGSGGEVTFGSPNAESGMSIIGSARADVRFDGSTLKLLAGPLGGPPPSVNGLAINTSGNVGVGTTAPGAKLHVDASGFGYGTAAILAVNTPGLAGDFDGRVRVRESLLVDLSAHVGSSLTVMGNLSKGSGSFKIDHPLDPANKFLYHSFVESPDMMNIYNGNVTLDPSGEAVVRLPDWFGSLNRDFRYQLTAIGAPGPGLYIAEEIAGNQFKIAGGKAGGRVSWQVTGVRQDAFANAHRIQVEEAKPSGERGRYLHPELFGRSAQERIGVRSAAGLPEAAVHSPVAAK